LRGLGTGQCSAAEPKANGTKRTPGPQDYGEELRRRLDADANRSGPSKSFGVELSGWNTREKEPAIQVLDRVNQERREADLTVTATVLKMVCAGVANVGGNRIT
jgi:hypothetical protein